MTASGGAPAIQATRAGTVSALPGPTVRRVRPPRWLDLRLVLGVLLVLGSVLLGAKVVSAAGSTVPVWSAVGDLAAGTVLAADDLVAVEVRLQDVTGSYLSAGSPLEGRTLSRSVRAGELVPRSAVEAPAALVRLALPVQAGYVPPDLHRGHLVDAYATEPAGAGAAPVADAGVRRVLAGVPVQAVSGRSQGMLSTPTTTVQVVVSVPPEQVPQILTAIAGRALVVVTRDSVFAGAAEGSGGAVAGLPASSGPASPSPSGTAD